MASRCVESKPTSQTVYLGKIPVNLTAINEATRIDQGYLSRIFSRKQRPSLLVAEKIANALDLTIDQFLFSLKNSQ